MYNYDNEELLIFFKTKIEDETEESISQEPYLINGYVGQGISRTVFSYDEYPDIVFKINIGEDGLDCYDCGMHEEDTFYRAKREDVAYFFNPTEYIGKVKLSTGYDEEDECYYENESTIIAEIYIQPKIDATFDGEAKSLGCNYYKETSLKREKAIIHHLVMQGDADWLANELAICALVLRKYGLEEYMKLYHFIESEQLSDLHGNNWAFKDRQLVLNDYAD